MSSLKRGLQQVAAAGLCLPGVRQATRAAAMGGLIPAGMWRRIPVTGPVDVFLPGGTALSYRSALMDHLGRVLFFNGARGWEPEVLRVLPGLAAVSAGVLDIGAHTGLFTLVALASNPAAHAVAVEPVLANARLAEANLAANRMADRCVLVVAAAAAEPGTVAFDHGPVEIPMTSAVRPDATGGRRVPAVSIDQIAPWLPSVDLIKIDVEGFEHLVLVGAASTLEARPTLVVECLPGSRVEEFALTWDRLGYRRFHLLPDRVVEVAAVAPHAAAATYNYVFAARPAAVAALFQP